eukprot:scaffold664_cov260-Pinguiococcus_pyrenoidosus.AAC.30
MYLSPIWTFNEEGPATIQCLPFVTPLLQVRSLVSPADRPAAWDPPWRPSRSADRIPASPRAPAKGKAEGKRSARPYLANRRLLRLRELRGGSDLRAVTARSSELGKPRAQLDRGRSAHTYRGIDDALLGLHEVPKILRHLQDLKSARCVSQGKPRAAPKSPQTSALPTSN